MGGKTTSQIQPALLPSKSYTIAQPLRIVLIMSPWNYPFHLPSSPLNQCDCSAAIVSYSNHPGTAVIQRFVIEEMLSKLFYSNHVAPFKGGGDESGALEASIRPFFSPAARRLGNS
jgi:hypothetical protein